MWPRAASRNTDRHKSSPHLPKHQWCASRGSEREENERNMLRISVLKNPQLPRTEGFINFHNALSVLLSSTETVTEEGFAWSAGSSEKLPRVRSVQHKACVQSRKQ